MFHVKRRCVDLVQLWGWACFSRLIGLGNMIRLPVGDGALDVPFRLPEMILLISCKRELSP